MEYGIEEFATTGREDWTEHYIDRISKVEELVESSKVIDVDVFSRIIELLPCDLAARLRLVPDGNLKGRLSHLCAIGTCVRHRHSVGPHVNYNILSVEGSNRSIPFDCDMIIMDLDTLETVLVDFTASRSDQILDKKLKVLTDNITLRGLKSARAYICQVDQRDITVSISSQFVSDEPGTKGLKLMDFIASQPDSVVSEFIASCKNVYYAVSSEIANQDVTSAPGDYKELQPSDRAISEARALAGTQDDMRSFDFISDLYREDPKAHPYYESLLKLISNSQKIKPLIHIEGARVDESRDLGATLSKLSDSYLAKALFSATLTESVVSIDIANNIAILSEFPPLVSGKFLSDVSPYKLCVQQKKGHVFKIVFNPNHMDAKLKRAMGIASEPRDKSYFEFAPGRTVTQEEARDYFIDVTSKRESESTYFMSASLEDPKDSVWKKILLISALSSNDMENFSRSTNSLLESFINIVKQTYLGSCISHMYEIMKSILSSLRVSPSDNDYYVGVNGSYSSVTVVKMSSTLDSFSKCCYSVIYSPERVPSKRRTRLNQKMSGSVCETSFYTTDPNLLSYNLRVPFVYTSFATWELENNMTSGSIANGVVLQVAMDSMFQVMINRDQFAQASEQVRYLYMSAIGYGGSAASIADKTDFMIVRHHWEIIYLLRSFKLGAALTVLSSASLLSTLENKETSELAVSFPHTQYSSNSFSQTVSSMYVCNIFNKFRAFHEISEARCYNEILAEREIYRSRVKEDSYAVSGLSISMTIAVERGGEHIYNYITSPEFVENEVQFSLLLAKVESERYSGSCAYMVGASAAHSDVNSTIMDNIYLGLNKSPVEACTMRGSTDSGPTTEKHQGIRAASTVLEEVIREHGMEPKDVNGSIFSTARFFDAVNEKKLTFSIFSCALNQFLASLVVYVYRVVQKDQKGHREISVLNFPFRIGALFVETIARELSNSVSDVDVVHNPAKDKIIEDLVKSSFKVESRERGAYVYDNSDQKRWGPNHNMNFFAYVLLPMLRSDKGLFRMCIRVFDLTMNKRAKYPESLIDLILKKKMRSSNSEPIQQFFNSCLHKIDAKIFEEVIAQGMCQGIFHDTSSLVHAIKVKSQAHIIAMRYADVSVRYLTTSDDTFGLYHIPYNLRRIDVVKFSHVAGLRVGNLFNIVRSNPKSSFNFHIAELNSIFFKRGVMATPSLKQRIAKIDVGFGVSHIEDYLSASSSAANYLSSGGSYMGACIMTILNFTLHTEQWLRWGFAKSENYYKPVELGGFPVVEPLSTVISGAISNMYMRSSSIVSSEGYSRLIVSTLLCPPERVKLSDFIRTGEGRTEASLKLGDVTAYKGAGPLGLIQTIKTDKKLSQFERRHHISSWDMPESYATLRRASPIAKDFLFSIYRTTSINTLDTQLGVNSFFVRMAEPWVSFSRDSYKISKNSPFYKLLASESGKASHESMLKAFGSLSITQAGFELIAAVRRCTRKDEYEIMENQMRVRLDDALSLQTFLRSQEAETFKVSKISPTIQTVLLRGHSVADDEQYYDTILKGLSGSRAKIVINTARNSNKAYDDINIREPSDPLRIFDAVTIADNAVSLYAKFIRRNTKMILPNKVDTIQSLCVDILRNKFTERMGVITEGSLPLSEERSRAFAHTGWYNKLMAQSRHYENQIANKILRGGSPTGLKVGIASERALIGRHDNFSLVDSTVPSKTILIDSKSKDSFMNTIKTWLGAKIKVCLTRECISSLLSGRLTFAHDYYSPSAPGVTSYLRYTKNKYFTIKSRSSVGMHLLRTTVRNHNARRVVNYRHYLIFPETVDNSSITIEINPEYLETRWIQKLKTCIEQEARVKENTWYKVPKDPQYRYSDKRLSDTESDMIVAVSLTPGVEFEISCEKASLCISLTSGPLVLPVTYLNPEIVESFDAGYTITHRDLTVAARYFAFLKDKTKNFDRRRIASYPELRDALDFILVFSTIHTPKFMIEKSLSMFSGSKLTPIQLDLVRTALIKNTTVGVNYSPHRFSNYLLNMGHRRNHDHSFLQKKILGAVPDADSEDWDAQSVEEEYISKGPLDMHQFREVELEDNMQRPDFLLAAEESTVPFNDDIYDVSDEESESDAEETSQKVMVSWADEVIDAESQAQIDYSVDAQTAQHDIGYLLEDTDTDLATDSDSDSKTVNDVVNESTVVPGQGGLSLLNQLFEGINIDEVLDEEEDDSVDDNLRITETLNDLFTKAISGQYSRVIEEKDKPVQSEVTSHTIGASLEDARSIIRYLRGWLEGPGSVKHVDYNEQNPKDIASIMGPYLMMHSFGVLDSVNPLEKLTGSSSIWIPIELSALAVVSTVYL